VTDKCMACAKPLKNGERVMFDVGGEYLHTDCCGPERESYVNANDEPLGPNDPIPTGFIWSDDQ
jgi:hypothetical protein